MRLKNKRTGEIIEFDAILPVKDVAGDSVAHLEYGSLAELNEEWEDVPEEPNYFYCISIDGSINKYEVERYAHESWCKNGAKIIGNYFSSQEEAELAVRKLKAFKRLKDKGFRFSGYELVDGTIRFMIDLRPLTPDDLYPDLDLLFGGKE